MNSSIWFNGYKSRAATELNFLYVTRKFNVSYFFNAKITGKAYSICVRFITLIVSSLLIYNRSKTQQFSPAWWGTVLIACILSDSRSTWSQKADIRPKCSSCILEYGLTIFKKSFDIANLHPVWILIPGSFPSSCFLMLGLTAVNE